MDESRDQNSLIEQGSYVLFTKQGNDMCAGVNSGETECLLYPYTGDANTTWIPQFISGTKFFYLIHQKTGLCAYFEHRSSLIKVFKADPYNNNFLICVADVGGGYVAINSIDNNNVWDIYQESNKKWMPILAAPWNGGDNQRWRFVPVGCLQTG